MVATLTKFVGHRVSINWDLRALGDLFLTFEPFGWANRIAPMANTGQPLDGFVMQGLAFVITKYLDGFWRIYDNEDQCKQANNQLMNWSKARTMFEQYSGSGYTYWAHWALMTRQWFRRFCLPFASRERKNMKREIDIYGLKRRERWRTRTKMQNEIEGNNNLWRL